MNTIQVFRSGAEDRTAQAVFAADLNWAQEQGINVASLSIAMLPGMKDESAGLTRFLLSGDGDVLPVTLLNGELCLAGRYPSRGELIRWSTNDFSIISGQPNTLPIVWQRLLDSNGDTCPRCRDTGDTVQKHITVYRQSWLLWALSRGSKLLLLMKLHLRRLRWSRIVSGFLDFPWRTG